MDTFVWFLESAASAKIARARQMVIRATQPLQLQLQPLPGIIDCPTAPYAASTRYQLDNLSSSRTSSFPIPQLRLFQGCYIHVLVVSALNILLPLFNMANDPPRT